MFQRTIQPLMKTDSLFYRLVQEHPDLVFELAEWSPPAGIRYTLHAEDVKQTGFRQRFRASCLF